jgi:iron complex outermembrane receptor protein
MKSRWLTTSAVGALLLGSGAAYAQAPAATAAGNAPTAVVNLGDDIVVTARRREENLQKVPVAITAFSNKMLQEQAIASVLDLNKAVPGLTIEPSAGNPGDPQFSIRGRGNVYGAASGSVEAYFAEVPLSSPQGAPHLPPQFFDLQSIQVLKGPQGTLFGRNTTGGAVLVVPQAPTNDFGGYLRVQGGTYNNIQVEGAVNVPIVDDKVMARVAAFRWSRKGYASTFGGAVETVTNNILPVQRFANEDVSEIRGTLLIQPTSSLSNSTIITYHRDYNLNSGGAGLTRTGLATAAPSRGYGTRTVDTDVLFVRQKYESLAFINTSKLDLTDNLSVKNIFGYIWSKGNVGNDSDADGSLQTFASLPAFPRLPVNDQYTDEVQFQGNLLDNRLTYIFGGIVDITNQPTDPNNINFFSYSPNVKTCPAGTPTPPCLVTFRSNFTANNFNSKSAFGSITYKLTDRIGFTGGFRHIWDDITTVTSVNNFATVPAGPNAQGTTVGINPLTNKQLFQGNAYNVGVDFQATNNTLVYGGYRHGFKRGGFNQIVAAGPLAKFGPETTEDFYTGVKSRFDVGNVPVRLNIEGFYDIYKGRQTVYLANTAVGLTLLTTNIERSIYRGFDLDLTVDPTPWLSLRGLYSYVDAYNTKWIDKSVPGSTVNLAVNPVVFLAKNKYSISGRFHTDLADGKGELVLLPTVAYQSKTIFDSIGIVQPLNTQLSIGPFPNLALGGALRPAYTTVDLRVEWNNILGSRFSVAANATNLTNKLYVLGANGTLAFGSQNIAYGPPRFFTFEVSAKF